MSGLSIGLTVTGPRQRETIERALELGGVDSVQATWNLLERAAGGALAEAHAAGVGVIVKEALANGRLTARGDVGELVEAAHRAGCTADALALAAAQPWARRSQRSRDRGAAREQPGGARRGGRRRFARAFRGLREGPVAYWRTRAALPWN